MYGQLFAWAPTIFEMSDEPRLVPGPQLACATGGEGMKRNRRFPPPP